MAPRDVTAIELLRLGWTVVTGFGTLMMLILLREAWLDDWAIHQVRHGGTDILRLSTRGELWDTGVLTAAVASLFLTAVASYVGLGNLFGIPLLILCAISLVCLGVLKLVRRRRVFRALRLRPHKDSGVTN